jgi:hypothetical protein
MRKLQLTTPCGKRYWIHSEGYIERQDGMNGPGSPSWKFLGLVPVNATHIVVRLDDITEEWLRYNPLRYKNGNPRYTVCDNNHGTMRIWGNTKYHGVSSINIL